MDKESVWLGPLRGPVRMAAMGFSGLTALIFIWLMISQFLFDDAIGMHEMIRPEGRPLVLVMLLSMGATMLLGAIYFSDTQGMIEPQPAGFFDVVTLVTSRMAMFLTPSA